MNREELKDSITAYCLGALDPEEKKQVEEQIASGDPEVLQIYYEMMQVTTALPFEAPAKRPPRRLKQSILASVETAEEPEMQQVFRPQKQRGFGWGLSFGLATAFALALAVYSSVLKSEISTLRSQLEISQGLLTDLRNQVSSQERILNVVQSPELRIVNLNGAEVSPDSKGKVYWDTQENKAVFYAYDLPALAENKDYQLWMLRSDQTQPVDAGVFSLDENGLGTITLDVINETDKLAAFAVSLEPKGGVPQPTGDIYLVGNVVGG